MTASGPVVGTADVTDRQMAYAVLESAVRDAFGPAHSDQHADAVRRLRPMMLHDSLPIRFRANAFMVTLSA